MPGPKRASGSFSGRIPLPRADEARVSDQRRRAWRGRGDPGRVARNARGTGRQLPPGVLLPASAAAAAASLAHQDLQPLPQDRASLPPGFPPFPSPFCSRFGRVLTEPGRGRPGEEDAVAKVAGSGRRSGGCSSHAATHPSVSPRHKAPPWPGSAPAGRWPRRPARIILWVIAASDAQLLPPQTAGVSRSGEGHVSPSARDNLEALRVLTGDEPRTGRRSRDGLCGGTWGCPHSSGQQLPHVLPSADPQG